MVVRAGRLLIEAMPGVVRARLDTPESPFFEATCDQPDIAGTVRELLPPLPIASLDLAGARPDELVLTPYTAGVALSEPDPNARGVTTTIDGVHSAGSLRLVLDSARGAIRRLEIRRDEPAGRATVITMEHSPSTANLGSLDFSRGNRRLVTSLADLAADLPDRAVGTELAAAEGSAAAEVLARVTRAESGESRPCLVLLGSPVRSALSRIDAAQAAATLAAVAQDFAADAVGLPGRADRVANSQIAGFAMFWQGASAAEDQAVTAAIERAGGKVALSGLDGVEGEMARVAPGSAGAFVVLAGGRTIHSVHPLERLPADPEQQVAELVMALLDAADAGGDGRQEGR